VPSYNKAVARIRFRPGLAGHRTLEGKTILQSASLFNQLLQHFPRTEVAALVRKHDVERAPNAPMPPRHEARAALVVRSVAQRSTRDRPSLPAR
jgi:hypothetical protein